MLSTSQTAGYAVLLSVFQLCLCARSDILLISVAAVARNLIRKPLSPQLMETQVHAEKQIIIEGKMIHTCAEQQFWFSEITALLSSTHMSFLFVMGKSRIVWIVFGFWNFPTSLRVFANHGCCAGIPERTAVWDVYYLKYKYFPLTTSSKCSPHLRMTPLLCYVLCYSMSLSGNKFQQIHSDLLNEQIWQPCAFIFSTWIGLIDVRVCFRLRRAVSDVLTALFSA